MPHAARTALTRTAPLAVAALLILTGCGSDDGGGDAATATTSATTTAAEESPAEEPTSEAPAEGEAQSLSVTSVDFEFEVPSTDLTAGDYTIELVNDGGATHDLVVERDGEEVGATEQIGPGETSTATVTLEPGEYVFYCSVGNHRSMGMEVTVTVT